MKRIFTGNVFAAFGLYLIFTSCGFSQSEDAIDEVIEEYQQFREPRLEVRRIVHSDIQPLLNKLRQLPKFKVQKVGESIEGRDLSLISVGTGKTSVLLWSQMHGDESTATMALFDIFNFLKADAFEAEKEDFLQSVTLHFLPMLNPDGAENFQRRNALGIDVNRDALRLQSPEGKTLKRIRDSLDADWGFNLHDQSKYYNAQGSDRPATISFLAPAFNFEKSIDEKRADAMKVIVKMDQELQKHIPGQVARYNDDFEPRAFGDNIQKWGTRTMLIESGGNYDDPEKQEIRKMNFIAILTALFSIADESYESINRKDYDQIPHNDSKLFDLKLTGLIYELNGDEYVLDLGINHQEIFTPNERGFYYRGTIADQGDLSTNHAYKDLDATGYDLKPGRIYPQVIQDVAALGRLDFQKIISEGHTYVRVRNLSRNIEYTEHPVQVVEESFEVPSKLQPGVNPTFLLKKDGNLEYVVINGFLYKVDGTMEGIHNGAVLR